MVLPSLAAPQVPPWLDRMVGQFRRYAVQLEQHQMHVMESGAGQPVLLLHGNPTWGFLYRKVAAELAGEPLRLIMPDLIGLGLSDKPTDAGAHTLDNHGRWLAELVDRLGLEQIIFVGQDWGGPIGLRMLADRPGLLAGLVVLNTAVGPPKPGFKATAFHRFARLPLISELAFRALHFPQISLGMAQGGPDQWLSIHGDVARAYRYPLRGWRANVAPLALARMVPDSQEHPSIPALRRCQRVIEQFSGPSAIVWGDRDPVLGRVRSWIERLLPDARVTRTDAGHFLQEQVPSEIAAAIRDVAARLRPYPNAKP